MKQLLFSLEIAIALMVPRLVVSSILGSVSVAAFGCWFRGGKLGAAVCCFGWQVLVVDMDVLRWQVSWNEERCRNENELAVLACCRFSL